jgi:hypothetical protein
MPVQSRSGVIAAARTTTGQDKIILPFPLCVISLFITITGGSASVDIEISDDNVLFFALKTITQSSVVRLAIPSQAVAINVTAISGATIHATYHLMAVDALPSSTIEVFSGGVFTPPAQNINIVTQPVADGIPKRLYGPAQPANTAATVYTCPALTRTNIRFLHVSNGSSANADFTMSIGSDAAAKRLYDAYVVESHKSFTPPIDINLVAAEIVQLWQTTTGALTITMNGPELGV